MSKPKVAFYWCASCGGCEEAVVDLAEDILVVADAVEIVLWPVAMDFKLSDIQAMEDGEIAVSFINGAVRTEEQKEWVELLRKKSGLVVAFGACAHIGGIPGLANFYDRESIFKRVYFDVPTADNPDKIVPQLKTEMPEGTLTLPEFFNTVNTLDQVIDVDYYLPGCAPPPDLIKDAVMAILEGKLPPKGTVLSPDKSLCSTCPRQESKPDKIHITELKRVHKAELDPEKCFLAEGVLCLGPATRGGCGERCINGNMPCRGCFGPTSEVRDLGTKFLSALASIIDADDEDTMEKMVDAIGDPAGVIYMYNLPASIMKRKRMEV